MKIEHFEVRDNFLQKYIDYYYLLSTTGDTQNTTYLAFPSCNTPVGFFKNASAFNLNDKIDVKFLPDDSLEVLLIGNFLKPLHVNFEPNIIEFSIIFKPLAINFFVTQNLGKALSKDISRTDYFRELLPPVRKIIEGVDAFEEVESKLVSKFTSNKSLEMLESIITKFRDDDNQLTEQQISAGLNISTKQLFRLFKNHLGVNPTQYRQLLRFRNALNLSLKNCLQYNLTEVGHTAGYYDQSHFIKEFKKITNLAPREFLNKISLEAGDKIVWQFLSNMSDSYNQ